MSKVIKKRKITKHIELITTDDRKHNIRLYESDILSFKDLKDLFKYRFRVRRHKFNSTLYKFIIKRLAIHLLKVAAVKESSEDYLYSEYKIVYKPEGIDFYQSCKDKNSKKYCHGGTMFWALYFRDLRLLAHSEHGLYLEVIRKFLLEPYRFPFC